MTIKNTGSVPLSPAGGRPCAAGRRELRQIRKEATVSALVWVPQQAGSIFIVRRRPPGGESAQHSRTTVRMHVISGIGPKVAPQNL